MFASGLAFNPRSKAINIGCLLSWGAVFHLFIHTLHTNLKQFIDIKRKSCYTVKYIKIVGKSLNKSSTFYPQHTRESGQVEADM